MSNYQPRNMHIHYILFFNFLTMLKKIIPVVQIVAGLLFLLSTRSDIQLGFGVVLLTNGIVNLSNSKKS